MTNPIISKKFMRRQSVIVEQKRWSEYQENPTDETRRLWQNAETWRDGMCRHDWQTEESGGMHFSGGEVWDDVTETTTCSKCGGVKHVDYSRVEVLEPVTF